MKNITQTLTNNPKSFLFCMGSLSALAMAPVYAWPLMMIGYSTLLYLLCQAKGWRQCGTYAFVFFFGYFLAGLYWISSSLLVDFQSWWWALPLSFIGLPILLSLFPLVIFSTAGLIKRYRTPVFITALILTDIARGHLFTGFPWNMPAHTWTHTPAVMATLPYIGFYGLNILSICIFCLPATIYKQSKIAAIVPIVIIWLFSIFPIAPTSPQKDIPNNIIMVQANIPQDEKWDSQYIQRNLDRYISMSEKAISNDKNAPILVIWPETAVSQRLLSYPPLRHQFEQFINNLPKGSTLITGYLHKTDQGYMNGFAVFDDAVEITSIYNKHHLVPFGEYMPFSLDTITGFVNLQSGKRPAPLTLDNMDLKIFPLICYEIIFPHYASIATSSDIILNITNDAWFGNTAGPYQHFDHAIFRAIENNTPVIRLSGNGISGIITNHGQIISLSPLNEQAIISHIAP